MKLIRRIRNSIFRESKQLAPDFPQSIILEPTNSCNLRCRMCSIWGEGVKRHREVGFIKRELWEKFFDEVGSWPVTVSVDIHGAGEPLLHPDFLEIVRYAKSKKNIVAGFLCNATLFDPARAEEVVKLGIDWVAFSVDGAQKGIFEHYRRGAVLEVVERNIEHLITLRHGDRPGIMLNMVGHEEADKDLFINRWKGKVNTLQISLKRPVERSKEKQICFTAPCPLPLQQMVIGWNGYAVLCCEDCWGDNIIGRFPEKSLYTIWHGKEITRARMLHHKGRQSAIPICRNCDSQIFHVIDEFDIDKTRVRIERPKISTAYGRLCT